MHCGTEWRKNRWEIDKDKWPCIRPKCKVKRPWPSSVLVHSVQIGHVLYKPKYLNVWTPGVALKKQFVVFRHFNEDFEPPNFVLLISKALFCNKWQLEQSRVLWRDLWPFDFSLIFFQFGTTSRIFYKNARYVGV